mmetsp:Transcript_15977/g.41317  ORF Transcript_15977/g.41317 Transcript_15977/m.41317 type:complete len:303 (-) Transcript_15977:29-937(-)
MRPTRLRAADLSLICFKMMLSPMKPPCSRLALATTNRSPASAGVVVSSMSLPYRQRPASSLSESRAPRPMGITSAWLRMFCATVSECSLGKAISKPSSPVYPLRVTKQSTPATFMCTPDMNFIDSNLWSHSVAMTEAALGPCSARRPLPVSGSIFTSFPLAVNAFRCFSKCGRSLSSWPALITVYRSSPRFVTIQSSIMPPFSLVMMESAPIDGGRLARSDGTIFSMNSTRSLPVKRTPSMWLTSKRPAFSRVCRCDCMIPSLYWTGISQPAKGTIFAPRRTCTSYSAVRRIAFEAMARRCN